MELKNAGTPVRSGMEEHEGNPAAYRPGRMMSSMTSDGFIRLKKLYEDGSFRSLVMTGKEAADAVSKLERMVRAYGALYGEGKDGDSEPDAD